MIDHFADAFIPHGHCYLWLPSVLWLHVLSDGLIALSYFSIPVALLIFVRRRRDLTFRWVFLMFSLFILSCGVTHLMNIWTTWQPDYWAAGALKAVTAATSIATAWMMWPLLPRALALPSPQALAGRQGELEREIAIRKRAEDALHELNAELEDRVRARTADLEQEIAERKEIEAALKAAKAEAERANKAKSRFLAAASHDLRQPLSALTLYVDVLKKKVAEDNRPLLSNVQDCVGSLSELLADLLDLSKLDAGVVTPTISDFQVAEMLANLNSVHAPEARLKGLRLRCAKTQVVARTDPVRFRRMLGNLLSNAIRYTDHGGVVIGCRRRQGKLWVEVWDTGVGIPQDKISEVFEEFRQLDDARSKGSGLGLAIVKKSAALLGLQVRVRSRPGWGSLFAIELPIGSQVERSEYKRPEHRSRRIALVEDNESVREALAAALVSAGHEVVSAAAAKELHFLLGRNPPDIVISDYRLSKGETGFDVITSARAVYGEDLPAVLVTGDTDPDLLRSMASRGVVVLHKPLQIDALQACISAQTSEPDRR